MLIAANLLFCIATYLHVKDHKKAERKKLIGFWDVGIAHKNEWAFVVDCEGVV